MLGIEANDFRILTDKDQLPYGNDPVLYEPECFEIIDPDEPDFWECKAGEEGERYCYPKEWNSVGFFEDYHDGVKEIKEIFWSYLQKYYPKTWKESN